MANNMFDYLQKYQQVPADVKAKLDNPAVKSFIHHLEQEYHISLFSIIIKVMVKDIPLSRLSFYLVENEGLDKEQAQKLVADLQANVFILVNDYLSQPVVKPVNINKVVQDNQPLTTSTSATNNNFIFTDIIENALNKFVSQQTLVKKATDLNRLRQIAKTFLLGVRNESAFTDIATKEVAEGGLSLTTEQVSVLLEQLNSIKKDLDQQARKQISAQPLTRPTDELIRQSIVQDFESDLLVSLRQIDNKEYLDLKTESELAPGAVETAKLLPPITEEKHKEQAGQTITPNEASVAPKPAEEQLVNQAAAVVIPLDQRTTDIKTGKIRMDDVKFTPKTLTPVDELATISLKKFRYLGSTAAERAQKIKEKIDLLSEYGYSKRLQGINAWRHSPLNSLYLKIGQLSIDRGQPAEQILAEAAQQGEEDTLTLDEFKAILTLNQQLRF